MNYIVRQRALLGTSALLCTALLLLGCQDTAIPVGPDIDQRTGSEIAGKKPNCDEDPSHPSCGDDGGGSGGGLTVEMQGGVFTVAPQDLDVQQDNKNRLGADIIHPAEYGTNLVNTKQNAEDNPETCNFDCDATNPNHDCPAVRLEFIGAYVTLLAEHGGHVGIDKRDALAEVPSGDHGFQFGANINQFELDGVDPAKVTYDDGDGDPSNNSDTINDASIPRIFTVHAGFGTVTKGKRLDSDGDGIPEASDDHASLICPLMDEIIITVAPSP